MPKIVRDSIPIEFLAASALTSKSGLFYKPKFAAAQTKQLEHIVIAHMIVKFAMTRFICIRRKKTLIDYPELCSNIVCYSLDVVAKSHLYKLTCRPETPRKMKPKRDAPYNANCTPQT